MASLVAESWAYNINGDDISDRFEISKVDTNLLMSLLEESNGEEYNDEQLNRVIQSLEAEIKEQNTIECHDLAMEPDSLSDEEYFQNCLAPMDFGWTDNIEVVPSSPSDDMNWSNYMDQHELDLDHLVETEGVCDYSYDNFSVLAAEEDGFIISLWHENTYDVLVTL